MIESSCGKYAASELCVTAGKKGLKAGEAIILLLLERIQHCVASVGFFKTIVGSG